MTFTIVGLSLGYFLFLLLPSLAPHYGFYSDELYYLACAERLDLGYVDHPPLFVFALRLTRELLGESPVALRTLPAAAGVVTALLTGLMARRMGGGSFAQVVAMLAIMTSGTSLALFSWFSVNCLEVLLWTAASLVFLEICRTRNSRLWVLLGVVLGASFLTKHTVVLLIVGLAVATVFGPLRRELLTHWPWIGMTAAAIIVSPNVYWQMTHDWISLDFYRGVEEMNQPTSPLEFVVSQIEAQNPATLPLWLGGFYFFFASARGRRFRPLGVVFVTVFLLGVIGGQSRADRIAGVYPLAFAAGAVVLEAIRDAARTPLWRRCHTYALPALMVISGLIASTLILPILPPDLLARHPLFDGDDWRRAVAPPKIPYHLANRTHWKDFVSAVVSVHGALDSGEREGAVILADYFGHAGAIEYYGRAHGLPRVYSAHTGYFLWGPPEASAATVIAIGIDEDLLRASFETVAVAATFRCADCPAWQNDLPIHVARSPTKPIAALWAELARRGGMDRYARLLRAVDESGGNRGE